MANRFVVQRYSQKMHADVCCVDRSVERRMMVISPFVQSFLTSTELRQHRLDPFEQCCRLNLSELPHDP